MAGWSRLADYEAEALALPGVRKRPRRLGGAQGSPRLQLIVLTDGGTEAEAAAVAAAMTSPTVAAAPTGSRSRPCRAFVSTCTWT